MPTHDHGVKEQYNVGSTTSWSFSVANQKMTTGYDKVYDSGASWGHNHIFTGTQNTHNHTFTGTSFTFDNNPPYKVAYCYKRVS